MRIIAIGDIHGHFDKFQSLWNQLKVTDDDQVIFLGDYIDRGTQNMSVLETVMKLNEQDNVTCLMGNHEDMLFTYYSEPGNPWRNDWLYNGGETTKEEIESSGNFQRVYDFVKSLKLKHELTLDKKYIFCHAGIDPYLEEQDRSSMLWIREEFYDNYEGDDIYVVGHTPTICFKNGEFYGYKASNDYLPVKLKNNIYDIDTGSYFDEGKITAWIYDGTISYLQSDGIRGTF